MCYSRRPLSLAVHSEDKSKNTNTRASNIAPVASQLPKQQHQLQTEPPLPNGNTSIPSRAASTTGLSVYLLYLDETTFTVRTCACMD
jgi:hypothetical protein